MKKITTTFLIIMLVIILVSSIISACNVQMIDTTWHFDYAQIKMPDGSVVEGKVESRTDFGNKNQIQINIDGVQYRTHSSNVVLISK